uniref:HSF_DOMAIN domain-containing protein n=1 Tax=Panagrellus redivivus TaxID=6233 RepID=A0A7E4VBX8_PANRE
MSNNSKDIEIPGISPDIAKALPVFLVKLLRMLEDEEIDNMICWDKSGKSFHIHDTSAFCDVVLPQYFKHRNLNSFVRQLNFYGFRKLAASDRSTLHFMDAPGDDLHFMHPKFIRGWPDLMFEIKRQTNPTKKLTAAVPEPPTKIPPAVLDHDGKYVSILQEDFLEMVNNMRILNQRTEDLQYNVQSLNEGQSMMWQEMRILRETNMKQTACFNKLISFLISVLNPPAKNRMNARRARPFVDNSIADQLVVAPRHGGDVLACIQNEINEFASMHKLSSLDPDNKDRLDFFDDSDQAHGYVEEQGSPPPMQNYSPPMKTLLTEDDNMLIPAGSNNFPRQQNQLMTIPKQPKPIVYANEPRRPAGETRRSPAAANVPQYIQMPSTSVVSNQHPNGTVMKHEPSYFDSDEPVQQLNQEFAGLSGNSIYGEEELMEFLENENMHQLDTLIGNDPAWTNTLMELSPH